MIKNSQRQSGYVLIIIVVILALSLLSAIGFIFWQNFINKADTTQTSSNQQTTVTTSDSNTANTSTNPTPKTFTVSEFGITLNKPNNDESYRVIPQDDSAVFISNDTLDAYLNSGTDCEVGGVQLSRIPAASATDNARIYSSAINGYKYGIATGLPNFAQCNDNEALIAAFSSVRDALITEISSIK